MSDLKLSLIIEAIDRVTGPAQRMLGSLKGMSSGARTAVAELGEHLGRFSTSIGGLAAAAGGGLELRDIIGDVDAFKRMRVDTGATADAIEGFEDKLYSAAIKSRVSFDEMKGGVQGMLQQGMGLKDIAPDVDALGAAIQQLGGQGEDLGKLAGVLQRFDEIKGPQKLLQTLATFREQFGTQTDAFKDFINAAPALVSMYADLGQKGAGAASEIAGLYATMARGSPDPRLARSMAQDALQRFADPNVATFLQASGVPILGRTQAEAWDNLRHKHIRPLAEFLPELIKRYNKAPLLFDQVLGPQFRSDFRVPLAQGYDATLGRMFAAHGSTAKFLSEAKEKADTFGAALSAIHASIQKLGEDLLGSRLGGLADRLGKLAPEISIAATAIGGLAIAAVAAGWIGRGISAAMTFGSVLGSTVVGATRLFAAVLAPAAGFLADLTAAMIAGTGPAAAFGAAISANPIGAIVIGVTALAGAAYELYEHWDAVNRALRATVDLLPSLPSWMKTGGIAQQTPGGVFDPATGAFVPVAPAPSAFDRAKDASGQDKKQAVDVGGELKITFENAPAGMKVQSAKSNSSNVGFDVNMGLALTGVGP